MRYPCVCKTIFCLWEMLDINPITLTFQEPDVERSFRESYNRRFHFQSLMAMGMALLLFCAFGVLDWLLYPDLVVELWGIRYVYALLPLLLIMLGLAGKPYWRYSQQLMALSLIVGNLAIIAMTVVIPAEMNDVYVGGLMLVALYGYTVARIRFVWASMANWLGLAAYNLANIWWGDASQWDLIAGNFFCASTNLLGMVACYSMEYDTRRGYLLQLALKEERSRLNEVNRRLEKQALTDDLTKLSNRRSFFEHYHEEWRRAKRHSQCLALIMIDVDYFKRVNDRYGHQAGDECLKLIGGVLASHARRAGEMAARLGGEEFILLLPDASAEKACEVAEAMRSDIASLEFIVGGPTAATGLHLTISCGTACDIPDDELSPEKLLSRADKAMYEAKEQGRDLVVCRDIAVAELESSI